MNTLYISLSPSCQQKVVVGNNFSDLSLPRRVRIRRNNKKAPRKICALDGRVQRQTVDVDLTSRCTTRMASLEQSRPKVFLSASRRCQDHRECTNGCHVRAGRNFYWRSPYVVTKLHPCRFDPCLLPPWSPIPSKSINRCYLLSFVICADSLSPC